MPPKTNTDGTTIPEGDGEKPGANKPDPKPGEKPGAGESELTYDTWVGEQPENVQKMLEANTTGLKSALDSERTSNKDLEGKLREAAKKAEGEAKEQYTKLADEMKVKTDAAEQKAEFFADAQKAGVSNLKLAYTVAVQEEFIDKKGRVNFEQMKKDYPELFGTELKTPKGHGGSGNNPPVEGIDMNKFIRNKAAGK